MSEEDDRNRYQNTCHFLRLNSNNRKYNYSLTEIQNVLEHEKTTKKVPMQDRLALLELPNSRGEKMPLVRET